MTFEVPEEADARLAAHLRSLGRMYPVLAHDLHAYLNTMVLNAEIIQRLADQPTPEACERIRRSAILIASELAGLERMLKAVVGQTRLSEPAANPVAGGDRFDLRALVEEISLVFESYSRHRRIRWSADLGDMPLAVVGNRDAVKHALVSCIMGAVDDSTPGDEISLVIRADRSRASVSIQCACREPTDSAPDRSLAPVAEGHAAAARERAVRVLARHGALVREVHDPRGRGSFEIEIPLTSPHA